MVILSITRSKKTSKWSSTTTSWKHKFKMINEMFEDDTAGQQCHVIEG